MIFSNIPETTKTTLLANKNIITKEYLRGEKIYLEEDLCSSIAIIKRGVVKAIQSFSDGHEKIIRILNQNEIIGLSLIFSSLPYYKASFYCETLCTICFIKKEDLIDLMKESEQIQQNVLSYISDFSMKQTNHIRLLSYKTIRQKLCAFFYMEYQSTKAISFVIPYTKTELAAFLNVERPSLSLELSKLIQEGILANQNKLYTILNIDALQKEL